MLTCVNINKIFSDPLNKVSVPLKEISDTLNEISVPLKKISDPLTIV